MKNNRYGFWLRPDEWLYHCPNILCLQFFWFHFHSWFSYRKFPYFFFRFIKVDGSLQKRIKFHAVLFWKPETLEQARKREEAKLESTLIEYDASETAAAFHTSTAFVRGIRGPVGGGKTVACLIEILSKASQQAPDKKKRRRTRWAVVRNTAPELKTTTIKSWQDWVPTEICPIRYDSPITGNLKLPLDDGTTIYCEVIFLALDIEKDVKKLLSLELTGAYINEAKEISKAVLDGVTQRVGRYPSMKDGGATWNGVIMDTNSPDDDHWWYEFECVNTPRKWAFFPQPGALLLLPNGSYIPNPKAENVKNHVKGYDYWLDMLGGKDKNWIKAFVLNEFATTQDGKPVYGDYFNEQVHNSANEFLPIKGLHIIVSFDFGLTPALVVGQVQASGQLRILDEVTTSRMGLEGFLKDCVNPLMARKYRGFEMIVVGDPSGVKGSDNDEKSCFDILKAHKYDVIPAPSNALEPRLGAVTWWLSQLVGKGQPGFSIGKNCTTLRKGFAGGYKFERVQVGGAEARYRDMPCKNKYSHPHDALQYLCMIARPEHLTNALPAKQTDHSPRVVADKTTGY